jgi:RNA polymerase sigma-70 factor (ECF subfamily)
MTDGYASKSDAELILLSADDADAFRVVYDRHARGLYGFFLRRTGDGDAALELVAETFSQAWLSRRRFRDLAGGTAGPWLFAIARRLLLRAVARQQLESSALERLGVDLRVRTPVELVPTGEWLDGLDAEVAAALDELPDGQRQAIELRVLCDMPYRRVAKRLGCSPVAARIRVSRGLATLRARLEASQC